MTNRYASQTEVSSESSRAEIERTLRRYGADKFFYGWDDDAALVGFRMNGKMVQFRLQMPQREEFARTEVRRQRRSDTQIDRAWEQATRQSWRALALVVKAKLEAVTAGIASFEEEFLAYLMVGDGTTFGDRMIPQIEEFYASGVEPRLQLGSGS